MNKFENPLVLEPEKQPGQKNKELPKNVVEIETVSAKYKIAYVSHFVETNPEVMKDCDAIVLEGWTDYTEKEVAEGLDPKKKMSPQYKELILSAIEQKRPIFLFDLTEEYFKKDKIRGKALLSDHWLKNLEAVLGAGLIYSGANKIAKKESTLSRRDFIKNSAKILGGIYFAYPKILDAALEDENKEPDESSLSRKFERRERDIRHTIHPELNPGKLLGTRNCLAAQKSETISRILADELDKKPSISLVMGAHHHGVENLLKEDQESRIKKLQEDLGKDFESQRFIARIDFLDRTEVPFKEQVKLHNSGNTVAKITIFPDPAFENSETK